MRSFFSHPSGAGGLKFVVPKEFLPNLDQEFIERPIRTHENVPQMDLRNSSKVLLNPKVMCDINLMKVGPMEGREN